MAGLVVGPGGGDTFDTFAKTIQCLVMIHKKNVKLLKILDSNWNFHLSLLKNCKILAETLSEC